MRKLSLALLIIFLSSSCALAALVEPGVSLDLARQRKSAISDIVYNLSLKLDTAVAREPEGKIEILFNYQPDNEPLQIDFAGETVSALSVNGKRISSPVWSDGHIVVDNSLLKKGANEIVVSFTSASRALNRNPGYLYSLFVPNRAHSVFPCFDQPDMKAVYHLTLTVPSGWKAVSNSPVIAADGGSGGKVIEFYPTEPLSTYLFAFAAGEFDYREHSRDGRTIGAYYRETDPERLAQLDEIFSQVESSLVQLEEYTGIPYPFAKYDLVILPGFQFGGMEHTGATFYNDNTLFLNKNATGADRLKRAKLIAHETAHMWFGDFVTMEWFNDVWTKEVFANFFAARLTRALLPEFDHDLEWLRVYMEAALEQDRGEGTTPIRQELDNLKNAGLIYNNIIYNKSPLMMGKLAEITGEENFKRGIRNYLASHAYGNATWDDLIAALNSCSEADIQQFSRAWVYEAGMPRIDFSLKKGQFIVNQKDPLGRDIVWPQTFDAVVSDGKDIETVTVVFDATNPVSVNDIHLHSDSLLIIPAADGRAYGLLSVDEEALRRLMKDFLNPEGTVAKLRPVGKLATLMMFNENYLDGRINTHDWIDFLIKAINATSDPQMLAAMTRYVGPALIDLHPEEAIPFEQRLFEIADVHPLKQARTLVLRQLINSSRSSDSIGRLFTIWEEDSELLGQDDISDIALQIAVAIPDKADDIFEKQRSRINDPDRLRKFNFVSRAASSDTSVLDSLFVSLSDRKNRLIEPWTLSLLSLLNHPSRQERSLKYIIPALELLPEIQATGDIFFPANWSAALLNSYRSKEAAALVRSFLEDNATMNPLLLNKVRQAASRLMVKQR